MTKKRTKTRFQEPESVAGNGLLHRRALLGQGALFAGAAVTGLGASLTRAAAEPLVAGPWSNQWGRVIAGYQTPSPFESNVVRTLTNPDNLLRTGHARTPHHMLKGITTPNGLHFTICHSGVPDIDPSQHEL